MPLPTLKLLLEADGQRVDVSPKGVYTFADKTVTLWVACKDSPTIRLQKYPGTYTRLGDTLVDWTPGVDEIQVNGETLKLFKWATPLEAGDHWVYVNGGDEAWSNGVKFRIERRVTTPAPVPDPVAAVLPPLGRVANTVIEGKRIQTVKGGNIGIEVGDNVTLRNISFTDDGGYLVKVSGKNVTIDGMTCGTFNDYAIYAEGAKNLTIRNLSVVGGSKNESLVRLADVDGVTIEDSTLDYRPWTGDRKAVLRGYGKNIVLNRVTLYGAGKAPAGLTSMTGFDAGEAYIAGGMLRITQAPWIVTVVNRPEWEAAVKQVVEVGIVEHEAILREVLKRVPVRVKMLVKNEVGETVEKIVTLEPSSVDVKRTASERVQYLAQRAEGVFNFCIFIDTAIRNSAGGTQKYFDCRIHNAGEMFHGWNEPTYPNPGFLLPGDVKRPAPVTEFTRCGFWTDTWTRDQFIAFCAGNGIKLFGCSFNGGVLPESQATGVP